MPSEKQLGGLAEKKKMRRESVAGGNISPMASPGGKLRRTLGSRSTSPIGGLSPVASPRRAAEGEEGSGLFAGGNRLLEVSDNVRKIVPGVDDSPSSGASSLFPSRATTAEVIEKAKRASLQMTRDGIDVEKRLQRWSMEGKDVEDIEIDDCE
jgi:hypothetical protein